MCDPKTSFLDLEDSAEWEQETSPSAAPRSSFTKADTNATVLRSQVTTAPATTYTEKCPKCSGTGRFYSYTGRLVGECFHCKGKGTKTFKTSPETRAHAKAAAAARKQSAALDRMNKVQTFENTHPEVMKFLKARAGTWDFADSLLEGLGKYGSLTSGQVAAVERCIEKDAARKAERAGTGLDLTELPSGMYAVPDGDTRLKLRVSRPRKGSHWEGYIFVDDGAAYGSRQKYGRQAPQDTYAGKVVEQLRAILADPKGAMAAYGHLTGTCGKCGRVLEDPESIERGIGPVCAKKMGA